MAVGFDENADRLVRTSGLPNCNAPYTVTAWVKLNDISSNFRIFQFGTITNATSDIHQVVTTPNWRVTANNSDAIDYGIDAPQVGEWVFVAMRRNNGASLQGVVNSLVSSPSTTDVSGRVATLAIGLGATANQPKNFLIAAAKLWTAALTNDEIAAEMLTVVPRRTADLYGWWPLETHTDLDDYSGNGRHWTGSGTLSTEAGPGIPWDLSTGGGTLTPTIWVNKLALEVLTM